MLQFQGSEWLSQNLLNDFQETLSKLGDIIDLCVTQLW